jgi:hypothetical protein
MLSVIRTWRYLPSTLLVPTQPRPAIVYDSEMVHLHVWGLPRRGVLSLLQSWQLCRAPIRLICVSEFGSNVFCKVPTPLKRRGRRSLCRSSSLPWVRIDAFYFNVLQLIFTIFKEVARNVFLRLTDTNRTQRTRLLHVEVLLLKLITVHCDYFFKSSSLQVLLRDFALYFNIPSKLKGRGFRSGERGGRRPPPSRIFYNRWDRQCTIT